MNFNPFDLTGPDFLVFYAILAVATIVAIAAARWWTESAPEDRVIRMAKEIGQDPYQIAFLRGGRAESLRVAIVSLIDRGLLKASGKKLVAIDAEAAKKARRPLEKAILGRFATPRTATTVYDDPIILAEAQQVGRPLEDNKLLPGASMKAARYARLLLAVAILWVVAGAKIYVALSRGRHNIIFLILMAAIAAVVLVKLVRRPRTVLGDAVCKHIGKLFSGLQLRRNKIAAHDAGGELTFLAAAFGMAALPSAVSEMVSPLELQHRRASQGWSSCGSCGSTGGGGSSCGGSSCGGGGCGGGCGGCGG